MTPKSLTWWKESTKMIAASCNEITEHTLWLSWRKILPLEDDDEESQEDH